MSERDVFFRTLDAVAARMQRNRARRALGRVLLAGLAAGLAAALLQWAAGPAAGRGPLGLSGAVLAAVLAGGLAIAWLGLRPVVGREAAAREADRRAGTRDLFVSALEFSASGDSSAWKALVQRRAATASAGLDAQRLVRPEMPASAPVLALLALLALALVALWSAPPRVPAAVGARDAAAAPARDPLAAELRALAEEAARRGDAGARAGIDAALSALEAEGLSPEQRRKALDAARDALARRALEAEADWEQLRRVAESLEGRPEFREVARALRQRDAAGAAEALRKVAEERGEKPAPDQSAGAQARPEALKEALQAAAQEARDAQGETSGRFQKAVKGLEELAAKLDIQQRLNQAARKLDAKAMSLQRAATVAANRYGQQEGTPSGDGAPETGAANISGGTMYRMGAVAQEKESSPREGGRAGDASGSAEGGEVLGDKPAPRPAASYQLERIEDRARDDAGASEDVFYAASRQGEARVAPSALPPVWRSATEEAMSPERVALRHRSLVREYFDRPTQKSATP